MTSRKEGSDLIRHLEQARMSWADMSSFAKAFRCARNSKEANMPETEHLEVQQRDNGRFQVVEGAMGIVTSEALRRIRSQRLGLHRQMM
jgi:hypothetical protein